ncbi:MAG TPA: hypothetical protein VIX89_13790 [Bryobacteraceae bacterium]
MTGTLYVFLHGLTVSRERWNTLEVVLPQVPGHVLKAGGWLAETPLRNEGLFQLRGVRTPAGRPPGVSFSQKDFTVRLPAGCSLTSRYRGATLLLPSPGEILGLRCATDLNYVAQTIAAPQIPFKKLASVVVLVYPYRDDNEVQLDGHYWQPTVTGQAMSLHIISTSEEPEGLEHEQETEYVMGELVRNYPGLKFNPDRPLPAMWMDPSDQNYGDLGPRKALGESIVTQTNKFAFLQAELEDPAARAARIALLGRLHQARQSIKSLWQWPDALSASASNCPPVTLTP